MEGAKECGGAQGQGEKVGERVKEEGRERDLQSGHRGLESRLWGGGCDRDHRWKEIPFRNGPGEEGGLFFHTQSLCN